MSCARETTLIFFVIYFSLLMAKAYFLVNLFEKPVHNAVMPFSCYMLTISMLGKIFS